MTGPLEITGIPGIVLGLVTGIMLGIFLDKGKLTKYETIVGQFLLQDFTMLKIMLSAVLAGSIGIYIMSGFEMVELHLSPLVPKRLLIGSALFGCGMSVLGYCPGSGASAAGTGKIDALFGVILGGLAGAAIYAEAYPFLKYTVLQGKMFEYSTIDKLLNVNQWIVISFLSLMIPGVFYLVELYEKKCRIKKIK